MDPQQFKEGDRVTWTYTHHLNRRSTTRITKEGTFLRYCKMRKGATIVKGVVQFDKNLTPRTLPVTELRHDS